MGFSKTILSQKATFRAVTEPQADIPMKLTAEMRDLQVGIEFNTGETVRVLSTDIMGVLESTRDKILRVGRGDAALAAPCAQHAEHLAVVGETL